MDGNNRKFHLHLDGVCPNLVRSSPCRYKGKQKTTIDNLTDRLMLIESQTIATNKLMLSRLGFHHSEILLRVCPMAAMQSLVCAWYFGEFSHVKHALIEGKKHSVTNPRRYLVPFNTTLALMQNKSSFSTSKTAGPLAIAICANVKQAALVVSAFAVFSGELDWRGVVGVCTVLTAGICCSLGKAQKST